MKALCLVIALALLALALASCSPHPVIERTKPPEIVTIPTTVPCVGERPAEVVPLKDRNTDEAWAALDVKQQTALTGAWALEVLGFAQGLKSATTACR